MNPLANIAVRAARRAGAIILRSMDRIDSIQVRSKRQNDFVTEVDKQAEQAIIETIRRAHPDHGILAEESGRHRAGSEIEWIVDLAHNPDGAAALATTLSQRPAAGSSRAVFGMLADKDVEGVVSAMGALVDHWYLGGLEGPRGLNVRTLQERAVAVLSGAPCHGDASVAQAYRRACADAQAGDRVVVFGSFHTVAEVLDQGL